MFEVTIGQFISDWHLQEPSDVQQTFSRERNPTVWRIIPSLEFLIKRWQTMAEHSRYRSISDAITNGVESFEKWYRKVDGTSDAHFICLSMFSPFIYCAMPEYAAFSSRS
jgi:hypothetical protein